MKTRKGIPAFCFLENFGDIDYSFIIIFNKILLDMILVSIHLQRCSTYTMQPQTRLGVMLLPKPKTNALGRISFWFSYGVLSLNVTNVFCSSKAEKVGFVMEV